MTEYKYSIKDDPKCKVYNSEAELKESNQDICEPDEHVWHTTFVFGVFDCRNCKARKTPK